MSLALSTDNGRRFQTLWTAPVGVHEATIDLGEAILRRYAYWLKLEIDSATPGDGAGIDELEVESDFQHAPRTLAWLGRGRNTINVAADGDPALATRTIACRITPDTAFTKNETTGTMGVVFDNLDVRDGGCWWKNGVGTMTVPVAVPGDLVDAPLQRPGPGPGREGRRPRSSPAAIRARPGARSARSTGRRPGRPAPSASPTGRRGRGTSCSGSHSAAITRSA